MNALELIEGKLAMAIRRIEVLEAAQRRTDGLQADELAAQQVAQAEGFAVAVLQVPGGARARRAVGRQLRRQGWSFERIARVLRVSEKTVRRWMVAAGDVRTLPRRGVAGAGGAG